MDLDAKLAAAADSDGIIRGLTDAECVSLICSGHGLQIRSTGRWVITDVGLEAVRRGEQKVA